MLPKIKPTPAATRNSLIDKPPYITASRFNLFGKNVIVCSVFDDI